MERLETTWNGPEFLRKNPKRPKIFMKQLNTTHENDQSYQTTDKKPPVLILRKFSPKKCSEFNETWYTYQLNHAENDGDNDFTLLIDTCYF